MRHASRVFEFREPWIMRAGESELLAAADHRRSERFAAPGEAGYCRAILRRAHVGASQVVEDPGLK